MNKHDLMYLTATLARAQQEGLPSVVVGTKELQAILHTLHSFKRGVGTPKPCGFIEPDALRKLCEGTGSSAKLCRTKTKHHTTQMFFMVIE